VIYYPSGGIGGVPIMDWPYRSQVIMAIPSCANCIISQLSVDCKSENKIYLGLTFVSDCAIM
jgi:hypothetical protein